MADARKLKDKVAKYLARQDYDAAHAACLELTKLEPRDDHALLKLGEIEERLGETDDAVGRYRRLVARYADDGRLVRAIAVARRILDLVPGDAGTQRKLALLYAARGLPPAAASGAAAEEARHAADHAPAPAATPAPEEAPEPAPPPEPPATVDGPAWNEAAPSYRPPSAASGQRILDTLASEEDPFRAPADEAARRQIAAADLESLDLSDLDLAFVELADDAAPKAPDTPLFSDLAPEELEAVLARVAVRRPAPGEAVVRQGEAGDSVFVVASGKVAVRVHRQDGTDGEVATLGEGDFFGEFGLFLGGRRQATVVAVDEGTELLEIRHPDLMDVAGRHPRIREVLEDFYKRRAVDTALAASQLFGGLSADARAALSRMVAVERHELGSMVLQEGDDGGALYFIRSGRLKVESRGLADAPVHLADLGPGDFFGEISLLSEVPVTADVVTTEATELLKLTRTEVLQLCGFFPEIETHLEAARQRRLHESIERLAEAGPV